ncbi:hypothetical protein STAS_20587 [Striga asiatica]|uniref:Uncharacterized protein n=1 Tax=Striga asiatica TaxID=4170 RepID=A0A5A7QES4_STRAF|nr:hypothetical protein STAS_20587 [Striga asiatica]
MRHKYVVKWQMVLANTEEVKCCRKNCKAVNNSNPETPAVSLPSSPLELPSLRSHIGLGVTVWNTRSWAKMLHCFTSLGRPSQENLFLTVFCPRGALSASWSKVKHSPPAFSIRALAVSVNLKAVTFRAGTSCTRMSSVTVPTRTAIFNHQHSEFLLAQIIFMKLENQTET